MKKTVQFEIVYDSDIKDSFKFNQDCDYKTMSIFRGIPTKGVFNLNNGKITYAIKKITAK